MPVSYQPTPIFPSRCLYFLFSDVIPFCLRVHTAAQSLLCPRVTISLAIVVADWRPPRSDQLHTNLCAICDGQCGLVTSHLFQILLDLPTGPSCLHWPLASSGMHSSYIISIALVCISGSLQHLATQIYVYSLSLCSPSFSDPLILFSYLSIGVHWSVRPCVRLSFLSSVRPSPACLPSVFVFMYIHLFVICLVI